MNSKQFQRHGLSLQIKQTTWKIYHYMYMFLVLQWLKLSWIEKKIEKKEKIVKSFLPFIQNNKINRFIRITKLTHTKTATIFNFYTYCQFKSTEFSCVSIIHRREEPRSFLIDLIQNDWRHWAIYVYFESRHFGVVYLYLP